MQRKKRTIVTKSKKTRARWDSEVERKLGIWVDILEEFDRKMMTRKKKEAITTTRLNSYISEELSRLEQYTEKEVCNRLIRL